MVLGVCVWIEIQFQNIHTAGCQHQAISPGDGKSLNATYFSRFANIGCKEKSLIKSFVLLGAESERWAAVSCGEKVRRYSFF
jgi:hypothetical protein